MTGPTQSCSSAPGCKKKHIKGSSKCALINKKGCQKELLKWAILGSLRAGSRRGREQIHEVRDAAESTGIWAVAHGIVQHIFNVLEKYFRAVCNAVGVFHLRRPLPSDRAGHVCAMRALVLEVTASVDVVGAAWRADSCNATLAAVLARLCSVGRDDTAVVPWSLRYVCIVKETVVHVNAAVGDCNS